jgi:hypothetical protein
MDHLYYATSIGRANSPQHPTKGMTEPGKYIERMMCIYMEIHSEELQA